jgi:S1-C subfamily serine protease
MLYVALTLALTAVHPTFGASLLALERCLVAIVHTEFQIKNIVGTGFVVAPSGLVVTVDHLITDAAGKLYSDIWAIQFVHPKWVAYNSKVTGS